MRTGYPSWMQDDEIDVLNDEDDEIEESEIWGEDCCDDLDYEEAMERILFGD